MANTSDSQGKVVIVQSEIRNPKSQNGFTLIELLVVITIIALLLGILIPAVRWARRNAENSASSQYMHSITIATQTYHTDFDDYPPSKIGVSFCGVSGSGLTGAQLLAQALVAPGNADGKAGQGFSAGGRNYGPYLDAGDSGISKDSSNTYVLVDAWGQAIQYYRANRGASSANLWGGGSSYRFDSGDNTSSPSNMQDYYSAMRAAQFLLVSIGADGKAGSTANDSDNVVVTGP